MQMNHKTFTLITVICLSCALVLGGCAEAPTVSTSSKTVSFPAQTLPAVTLDTIRTAELSDMPSDSPYYDTVCYMLYYGFMDAADGRFLPNSIMTYTDGADIISKLTGQEAAVSEPDTPLTRAQLAMLLHKAASSLGYSTEKSIETLPYPDADEIQGNSKNAMLWAEELGMFDSFVGYRLLPNTAVSRLQLAEALINFMAMDPDDSLAAEIANALPFAKAESAAMANHDAIQAAVDSAAKKYGAINLQVAVIEKGTVTDTYVYGFATKDADKMTADHKLRAASITKVAIGAAAQLLREEGKIELDADISEYWGFEIKNPHFPNDPITIRTILTHTSSITNASLSTPRDYDYLKSKLQSDGFSPNRPGNISKWSYNNHAFGVLGVTLELAAEETLNTFLEKRLFAPMDMDASFTPGDIKNTDLLATIYKDNGGIGLGTQKAKTMKSHTTPGATGTAYSGGLTASAYDLAKFFAMLAGDGIYEGLRLIDSESVELIESRTENTVRGGFYQALPLRYATNLYGREGIYFHTGSSMGVYNCASYDPVTGDGVIVLTSGAKGTKGKYAIYKVCEEINQYIYDVIE